MPPKKTKNKNNTVSKLAKSISKEKDKFYNKINKTLSKHAKKDQEMMLDIFSKGKMPVSMKTKKKDKVKGKKVKDKKKTKSKNSIDKSIIKIQKDFERYFFSVNKKMKNVKGSDTIKVFNEIKKSNKVQKKKKKSNKNTEKIINYLFSLDRTMKIRSGNIVESIKDKFNKPTGLEDPREVEKKKKLKNRLKIIGGLTGITVTAMALAFGLDHLEDAYDITEDSEGAGDGGSMFASTHGDQGAMVDDLDGDGDSNYSDPDVDGDGIDNDVDKNDDGWGWGNDDPPMTNEQIDHKIEEFCEKDPDCHEAGHLLGPPVDEDGKELDPDDPNYHPAIMSHEDLDRGWGDPPTRHGIGDAIPDEYDPNNYDGYISSDEEHDLRYPPCQEYYYNTDSHLGNANCYPKEGMEDHHGSFDECCSLASEKINNANTIRDADGDWHYEDPHHAPTGPKLCEQTVVGMMGDGNGWCRTMYEMQGTGRIPSPEGSAGFQTLDDHTIYFNPAQVLTDGGIEDENYSHDMGAEADLSDNSLIYERCCFQNDESASGWGQGDDSSLTWQPGDNDVATNPNVLLNRDATEEDAEDFKTDLAGRVAAYNIAVADPHAVVSTEIQAAREDPEYLSAVGGGTSFGEWTAGDHGKLQAQDGRAGLITDTMITGSNAQWGDMDGSESPIPGRIANNSGGIYGDGAGTTSSNPGETQWYNDKPKYEVEKTLVTKVVEAIAGK
jgi:hypothetical protein